MIYAEQTRQQAFSLSPEARALWLNYTFPGNTRELRNIVIRLTARHAGQEVSASLLADEFERTDPEICLSTDFALPQARDLEQTKQAARLHLNNTSQISLDATLELWERGYIEAALEISAGNISQAARQLGINRTTLYNRLEGWNRR
jgi:two-component system nitrogen regulation response regulator GlnG